MTNDPDIRFATSLVDYVFRRLALDHLPIEQARGARHPVDRGAQGRRPRQAESCGRRRAGAAREARGAGRRAPIEIAEQAEAPGRRRAALLPVRIEDAAGGLVLRLRDLRQHQRLLVSRSRDDGGPGRRPGRARSASARDQR